MDIGADLALYLPPTSEQISCLRFIWLFHRNYEFLKDELIQIWIAHELVDTELDAGSYFKKLEELNVFQLSTFDYSVGQQRYKLSNSFVEQYRHGDFFRIDDLSSQISQTTKHAALRDVTSATLMELYKADRLATLLILHHSGSHLDQVPRGLFLNLPLLRVLDFSHTGLIELPSSIGALQDLRYLNLSHTPLTTLPESLCTLYKMQTLKLRGCSKLVDLPEEIRKLIKLKHFEVELECLAVSMPPGLGDLAELQTLPAFVVGEQNGCHITELRNMMNLSGSISILRLENVSISMEAKISALYNKHYLQKVELHWTDCVDGFEVLQYLRPPTLIEELQIVGYGGVKFPNWIGDSIFYKLATITISDCRNCELFPVLWELPSLKCLNISDMHAVKYINFSFGLQRFFALPPPFNVFQSLEKLTVNGMPMLKTWSRIKKGYFPNLQKLSISHCPKLTSLPELSLLVSLQQLEIILCPLLESFPNRGLPSSLECLVIIDCHRLKVVCEKGEWINWGRLTHIPSIWIDYQRIILNTEVSDSGRNLTVEETRTKENKQVDEDMKEMIFGKKSKGGKFSSNSNLVPQTETKGEILLSSNLKRFSFAELRIATRNFHPDCVLHEDGFGGEFKGWIGEQPGTGIWVAVKRLNQEESQADSIWLAEVNYRGHLCHPNIVRLIGYCLEDEHRFLVYEHVPLGRLENHLFLRSATLSWSLRMKVALGVARGLAFLHSIKKNAMYRDFGTSDILLDMDYNAKLSCFDLRIYEPTDDNNLVTTRIMGAYGYASPEFISTGHLAVKSDVYGFGVVLLEMLSGQRVIDPKRPPAQHNLVEWAKPYLNNRGKALDILDSRLEGQYSVSGAGKAAELVLQCLSEKPSSRPNMDEIVEALEGLQDSQDKQ